jgi:hypothetical protein
MVNGFFTEKFTIEQSVKQGDALSCALFIIAMDPLLRSINNNEEIVPIILNPGDDNEIKINNASFADDITALCRNKAGIQRIINTYSSFSDISGIQLNVPKTEILILGSDADTRKQFIINFKGKTFSIVSQPKVKICGITFSNDNEMAYQDNITEKIIKLERQLNIWRQRNLSLEGKILVAKTYGISQILYSIQATIIKDEDVKRIENIIYRFIWNIPNDSNRVIGRISRAKLQAKKEQGGLNAPNIKLIDESLKYKFILRQNTNTHPVKHLIRYIASKNNISFNNLYLKGTTESKYINECIKVHNKMYDLIKKDLDLLHNDRDSKPHCQYLKELANLELKYSKEITNRQMYMVQNLRRAGIVKLGDLKLENDRQGQRFILERFQIWNSLPISWRRIINNSRRFNTYINNDNEDNIKMVSIGLNRWRTSKGISTKQIYNRLMEDVCKSTNNEELNIKHNLQLTDEDESPFVTCLKMSKNVKLRNIQYKILHNVYPTLKHLHKWRIKPSPNCSNCNVTETLTHAIWECTIAQRSMDNFRLIHDELNISNNDLTRENMIIGIKGQNALNTIITLLKQRLILQRENKLALTVEMIKSVIRGVMRIELQIAKKNNNLRKFNNKWQSYISLL